MAGDARRAALTVLERWRRHGAWVADTLGAVAERESLLQRDAALAARLCCGVLQNMALCDFYIDCYSTVKAGKLEPKVLDILRVSVYQLVFMDRIPDTAAVNEGVRLCRKTGFARASGLVNAVLRRVSENRSDLPEVPGRGTAGYLSVMYSHPRWIVDELIGRIGYDAARELLALNNTPAPVTAQVNTLKSDVNKLVGALNAQGAETRPHGWLDGCVMIERPGRLTELDAFKDGLFYIQDAAARLAVTAAAPKPGGKVLDACAAPGGKSLAAAVMMANRGEIISCDINERKLKRIDDSARRLGISIIRSRQSDARETPPEYTESFDAVIADVPCSGLGVIRKKPEIRYRADARDKDIADTQLDILKGCSKCVKPGGVLIYSTCTFRRQENEDVIGRFLADAADFSAEEFTLPEPVGASEGGMLTLWPNIHGTDGFFICKMRKRL